MNRFTNSDRSDHSDLLLEDAQLDAAVGGWTMKDIWARPTLGTYH